MSFFLNQKDKQENSPGYKNIKDQYIQLLHQFIKSQIIQLLHQILIKMGICASQRSIKQQQQRQQLKIVLPNQFQQEKIQEPQIVIQSIKEQSAQNSQQSIHSMRSIHSPGMISEDKQQLQNYNLSKKCQRAIGAKIKKSPSQRSLSSRSLSNCSQPLRGTVLQGVQFFSTNASKKYSFIHKKELQMNKELSFVQNNKTGKKVHLEILQKEEEESIKFIYWLKSNQLEHENILKNLEVHQDNTSYQLIYEYFDGCQLSRLPSSVDISEKDLVNIADQMFSVLAYLKNQQMIHGNMTINSWEYQFQSEQVIIKLIDIKPISISVKCVDDIEVLEFTPPDVLYKDEIQETRDLWAVMMIIYTLGKGEVPYKIPPKLYNDIPSVKQFILNYQFDVDQDLKKWSPEFRYFVSSLIGQKNKKKKKTFEQLQNSEWLNKYRQVEIPIQERLLLNMLNQKESCELQQAILEIMIQELEQETALQLQKLFGEFDLDLDMKLNKDELIKMFQKYTKLRDLEFNINKIFIDHQIKSEFMEQFTFLSLGAPREQLVNRMNLETTFNLLSNNKAEIRATNITKYLNVINDDLEGQFNELAVEQKLTLEQFISVMELLK
ncbi:unnamed protein product [Paramecium sonneborni]|uniref:Protein kinase domain-containing protein n=1 Tax=Paramecium sonneborni TaxID=65129 RepID=A0A8S1R7W8_9CILI|nr:unnamed protein product [Paramecium sonneborni]